MTKFKYTGPGGIVGRFGRLKTGDVVEMRLTETIYILEHGSDGWEKVDEPEDLSGVGVIVPKPTRAYDLTRIHWPTDTWPSLRRMTRSELLNVACAMRSLGAHIPTENILNTQQRDALFELVLEEVKRLRWDQPGTLTANQPEPAPEPAPAEQCGDTAPTEAPASPAKRVIRRPYKA